MSNLIVAHLNANSLLPKVLEIQEFLSRYKIDILLLNETKLTPTDNVSIPGYTSYRKDISRRSRGVAIFIRQDVPHTKIAQPDLNHLDLITLKLPRNLHISTLYSSPQSPLTDLDLRNLTSRFNKIIIFGDLNARHRSWGCHIENTKGRTLYQFSQSTNVFVLNPGTPTHFPPNGTTPTTIDIALVKNISPIPDLVAVDELSSDHRPIIMKIGPQHPPPTQQRKTPNFRAANWPLFRQIINNEIRTTPVIESTQHLEQEIRNLTKAIQAAKRRAVPLITKTAPFHTPTPPNIASLIQTRNRVRRLHQRTHNADTKAEYYSLNRQIRDALKTHRNESWSQKLQSLNPQDNSIWKEIRKIKQKFKPIPALKTQNSVKLTDKAKSNLLVNYLADIHERKPDTTDHHTGITQSASNFLARNHDPPPDLHLVTPATIRSLIRRLKPLKAPGVDEIQNILLQHLPKKAIVQLTYIARHILKFQHYPSTWKTAIVIPIQKANKDPADPKSYRPISLLPAISKIVEKIILERLVSHATERNTIPPYQFGFQPQHSTTHQIARIVSDSIEKLNSRTHTALVSLDLEKAFDTVWIDGLIYKLIKSSYPPYLVKLVHNYLSHRKMRVKINSILSRTKRIHSGVPQGAVISPHLFNVYTADIPQTPQTKVATYADDTAIYAHSRDPKIAVLALQSHLRYLEKYYTDWKITVNPQKSESIIFTKRCQPIRIPYPLKIASANIPIKADVKYLGVTLDQRLTFGKHINNSIYKASGTIKSIYPLVSRNSKLSFKNKKLLYSTVILPSLTYAAPIWSNASVTNLKKLQTTQNKTLRIISNSDRYINTRHLHEITKTKPIKQVLTQLNTKFYKNTTHHPNHLIKNITNKHIQNTKHKFPHELNNLNSMPVI